MPTTPIDSYHITYSSNKFSRRIALKQGNAYIGQLLFLPNGSVLPADKLLGKEPQLHYHLDDFANCLNILRHEKPLFLYFNGDGSTSENGIGTGAEPVGEGE